MRAVRGLLTAVAALTLTVAGLPATAVGEGLGSADGGGRVAAVCRGTTGVSVIVDYGRSGRPIDKRCAPGDPATGLAALTGAGLPYTFVPNQPGLVCTINGIPDPCNGAPVRAYWSYWHLRADRTWEYSSAGASSHNPAPGSTEGWAFGNGQPPRQPRPTPLSAPPPTGDQEVSRTDLSGHARMRHGETS